MSTTVSFHALAERELNDAAQFYESHSSGLGTAFSSQAAHANLAGVAPDTLGSGGFNVFATGLAPVLLIFACGYSLVSAGRWNEHFGSLDASTLQELGEEIKQVRTEMLGSGEQG